MAETVEDRNGGSAAFRSANSNGGVRNVVRTAQEHAGLALLLIASAIYLLSIVSPPHLMDDVDAVQAQIARNMLASGDWVTARLDGVPYLEKSPLIYWLMAVSFRLFGVHDWAARIPIALSSVLLVLATASFARWALGRKAAFYAGLALSTSLGLFLFTRILIPDVALTLTITLALYGFLRALENDEPKPARWAYLFWTSAALGVLLKGLIAVVFPLGIAATYLLLQRALSKRETWRRLQPMSGAALLIGIALPWHVLAALRNPPYLDFTMHSEAGAYHGFFWFYFFNEHLFRFLNMRYPRDYNTVPRWLFWVLQVVWSFPFSAYLPAAWRERYRGADRAARMRLLALCWIGWVMIFFTLSTTQEYYSMPCYPALAVLIGSAMGRTDAWNRTATRIIAAISTAACFTLVLLLLNTRGLATPGDISVALNQNPDLYTLSMGHIFDLTGKAFAYLRWPLALAALAAGIGAVAGWRLRMPAATLGFALMMVLFYQAARMALVVFDPYLGSYPLAEALLHSPPGDLVADDQYYAYSSIFFYTNRAGWLLNGRKMNLEYGSYAPGAPDVFLDDRQFAARWASEKRQYLVIDRAGLTRLKQATGLKNWFPVAESGGKWILSNLAVSRPS